MGFLNPILASLKRKVPPGFSFGDSRPSFAYPAEDETVNSVTPPDIGTAAYSPSGPSLSGPSRQPDIERDIYGPQMMDASQNVRAAINAPHAGTARQVIGSLFARRNPALAGIISGEGNRNRDIQNAETNFQLTNQMIQQNRAAQQFDLSRRNTESEIGHRANQDTVANALVNIKDEKETPEQARLRRTNEATQLSLEGDQKTRYILTGQMSDPSTIEGKEETARHNKAMETNTARGQNMVDNRQRELNQINRETKLDLEKNKTEGSIDSFNADMDRLATAANELKNHPGLKSITGIRGAIPNIPGTDAANAQAKFETLKSQVAFGVLQNMRNASKSGGALGQISDKEESMLASNLASLDKSQSKEQLQKSLNDIIKYTEGAKDRARGAFNRTYSGGTGGFKKNADGSYTEQ